MDCNQTYSIAEVAERIGCNPRWIRDQIKARRPGFSAHLIAGKWRFTDDDVTEILAATKITFGDARKIRVVRNRSTTRP